MSGKRPAGPSVMAVPAGDDRERLVCPDCGFVQYENPKVIVGAVCVWQDRTLLCRRAIEPRRGFWTMPAGFMELDETTAEGAAREVWEEARARVAVEDLLGVYEIPHIGQIYMVYRARLLTPDFAPGPESEDVALFAWNAIPWDNLAFPSVTWALRTFQAAAAGPVLHTARRR
jgi:ADP-ribose pyrophosphatase YjhB (NUDIX family)